MKRFLSLFLAFIMTMSVAANAATDTADYLINAVKNPCVAAVGGEWTVIGLARSGYDVDDAYFEKYYANVLSYVKSKNGILHSRKYTEYSRVVIALTAIGKNPKNVAGYDLVAPITDFNKTVKQGINGAIWALIALDCGNYGTKEIRNKYVSYILEQELKNGGWSLSGDVADADVTAMALIALSGYRDRADVKKAVERALSLIAGMENYNSLYSESAAQILTAHCSLGISYKDARFVKNKNTLVDRILSFRQTDGSFAHSEKSDLMATEQCWYSLVALERFEKNKTALFDMSDVFTDIKGHENMTAIEELASRGVINGIGDNKFGPEGTLTRAQFAAITVRALDLPITNKSVFSDVKKGSWYERYVNTAYRYGIVNGVSKSQFDPEGTITTQQACVMLERAAKLCNIENNLDDKTVEKILKNFKDNKSVSSWARKSVAFCIENNIIGQNATKIIPHGAVKRCRMAQMIYNMMKGAELL